MKKKKDKLILILICLILFTSLIQTVFASGAVAVVIINNKKDKNCLFEKLPKDECDYDELNQCTYYCEKEDGIAYYIINYNDGSVKKVYKTYQQIKRDNLELNIFVFGFFVLIILFFLIGFVYYLINEKSKKKKLNPTLDCKQ